MSTCQAATPQMAHGGAWAPVAAAFLLLAAPTMATAATFVVGSVTDSADAALGDGVCGDAGGACTLRAALMEAGALNGAPHTVQLGPLGTILLTLGALQVTQSVTVIGAGSDAVTVDAGGGSRVLEFAGTLAASIRGLTLRGGYSGTNGGGIYVAADATVVLDAGVLADNRSSGDGGGVYVATGGGLLLRDMLVRGNRAKRGGGFAAAGTVQVTSTWLDTNRAADDGGGFWLAAAFSVTDSTATGNSAGAVGGAAYFAASATGALYNVTFAENIADVAAGLRNDGFARLRHVTMAFNQATSAVGGVDLSSGAMVDAGAVLLAHNVHAVTVPSDVRCEGATVLTRGGNLLRAVYVFSPCAVTGATAADVSGAWFAPLTVAVSAPVLPTPQALRPVVALPATSVAIDLVAGACLPADARGQVRPVDGDADGDARCDAGAFEAVRVADVALSVTSTGRVVLAPAPLMVSATAVNAGPFPSTEVVIWFGLPPQLGLAGASGGCTLAPAHIRCPVGRLAQGSEASVYVTLATGAPGSWEVTASVTHASSDPVSGNGLASVTAEVVALADLGVALTAQATEMPAGAPVEVTLTVTNLGPLSVAAGGATVSIPAGVVVDDADGCETDTAGLTCADAIAVGEARQWRPIVRPLVAGTFNFDAAVFSDTADGNPDNNEDRLTIGVTLAPTPPPSPGGPGVAFAPVETGGRAVLGSAVVVLGVDATRVAGVTEPVVVSRLQLEQQSVAGAFAALGDVLVLADSDGDGVLSAGDTELGRGRFASSRADLFVELAPASVVSADGVRLWIAAEPPAPTAALMPVGGAMLLGAGLLGLVGAGWPRRRRWAALLCVCLAAWTPACGGGDPESPNNQNVAVVLQLTNALLTGELTGAPYDAQGLPLISVPVELGE